MTQDTAILVKGYDSGETGHLCFHSENWAFA